MELRRRHRSISAVMVLLAACAADAAEQAHEDLIGWMGDSYVPESKTGSRTNKPQMHVLSWYPRIFLYSRILAEEECDQLVAMAKPRVQRSGVSDATTGASTFSDIRTSSGMFFDRRENALIARIEDRLAAWTMLPPENGEGIQVLRYENGQKYGSHHDYFSFEGRDENGGNRMATVLMYLSHVEEGGETVFAKVPAPANQTADQWSECAMQGLAVKPLKGDAVVFWSIQPDGRFDPKSLHGGCPVLRGTKWSATKWIHVGRYALPGEKEAAVVRQLHVPPPPPTPPGCVDTHKLCEHWAESGECTDNPGFMVGHKGAPGACLKSCHKCEYMKS